MGNIMVWGKTTVHMGMSFSRGMALQVTFLNHYYKEKL